MQRNFKVGDRVRIRQWDDMASEFGIYDDYIACDVCFIDDMKQYCGREFNITKIREEYVVEGHRTPFTITFDMLEYAEEDELEVDNEAMDDFLGQLA